MLQRPRFKPHIQVERVKGDGVFLLWETGQAVLHGPIYEAVAPLIDGQRSSDEIVEKLSADTPLARIYYALHQLESRGYLMEADDSVPAHEAALWSIQGIDPVAARQRLAVSSVELRMVGGVEEHEAPFKAALEALGVRTSAAGDLLVVLTDDYLRDALRQVNQGRLERERPWLIARPVGRQIWMGPVFVPRKGACWECLAQRLRVNRPTDRYVNLQRREGGESAPVARAATVASTMVAWNVVATEVASILARECRPESTSSILTLDVVKWSTERHTVVRLPHCPACGKGESSSQPGLPIVFANQKKLFTRDGGHRVVTPDTTLARYAHHVSPITGVVTSLSRSGPPGDGVLHVYESGQNPDQVYADLASLRRGLRSGKSGKGASDTQARASALCEGLERHSGIFRGDEPRRLARLADLGDAAIHPNACMLFSERQYRERDRWNGRDTRYNYVPAPLSDDAVVSFTPAWSLTRKRVRYLPTALCYYGFVDPSVEPFAMTCSNGTAAGNTR